MSAMCTICQDNFGDGEQIPFGLECGHMFHSNCISQWFLGGGRVAPDLGKCPTCSHINSVHKFLRLYPTTGDDNDREGNEELQRSLLEMKREVTHLKSSLAETTNKLQYLSLKYQEESGAHACLQMEHKCFVNNLARELGKVEKGQEGYADVDKGLLKIASVFHFCSLDTSNLNIVDDGRDAVLAYAVWRKRPVENISSLIWRGADWRHLNKNEQSLLHIAASGGTATSLKFLLGMGELDVNGVDKDGATPLHLALMFEKHGKYLVEKCKLLVENGAEVGRGMPDKKGKTPMTLAMEHPNRAMKAELMKVMLSELVISDNNEGRMRRGRGGGEWALPIKSNSTEHTPNPNKGNMNGRGRGRGRNRGRGRKPPQSNLNNSGVI